AVAAKTMSTNSMMLLASAEWTASATKWLANASAETTRILREVAMLSSDPGQEAKVVLQRQIRRKRFPLSERSSLVFGGIIMLLLSLSYTHRKLPNICLRPFAEGSTASPDGS